MYEYRAEVLRVVDGDTVDVRVDLGFHVFTNQRLRLHEIDAPEKRGATRAAGVEAELHLRKLIEEQSPITIETRKDKRGKYGRFLAFLIGADGSNLNVRMVTDGHAVARHY